MIDGLIFMTLSLSELFTATSLHFSTNCQAASELEDSNISFIVLLHEPEKTSTFLGSFSSKHGSLSGCFLFISWTACNRRSSELFSFDRKKFMASTSPAREEPRTKAL